MTDHNEFKVLCEAATPGPWVATVDGVVPQVGAIGICGNWGYANSEANRSFIAAANPSVVRALVAEIERLREDIFDLNRELKIVTGGRDLHKKFKQEARAERNELRAENAALRKDSERLNWLDGRMSPVVENQNWSQPEGELVGYDWGVFGQCSSVRDAIDDAMSKEPSHV
jgi:hypothetical protein